MNAGDAREARRREALRALLERRAAAAAAGTAVARRPAGEPPVLSLPQQRLWFLHQLDPGSSAYNLTTALELTGELDEAALAAALHAIAARHDALRMTFPTVNGEPAIALHDTVAAPLPVTDISMEPARLPRVLEQHAHAPFDLAQAPLFRAQLVRLARDRHVLCLTVHHIVFDGWSITVLVRELAECYRAAREGRAPALAPLPIGYTDYAAWQRQGLAAGRFERDVEYWRGQLANLPVLDLPADRPRAAQATFRGASRTFAIDAAAVARLRALASGSDATLFMALAAGFAALLGRYSGQRDIVIGTPVAGRSQAALEGLIGLFANTLVLRTDLGGDPSFRALLARVRATVVEAAAHPDAPFEHLVERLQPERRLNRQPLFQVAFAMQHEGIGELTLPGLDVRVLDVPSSASKFDLTVALTEAGGGIAGSAEFSIDLFEGATIERMMAHYLRLLAAAVEQPDLPVSRLRIVDLPAKAGSHGNTLPAEAGSHGHTLPAEAGSHGRAERMPVASGFSRKIPLHETFEQRVAERPGATAVSCAGRTLTYGELNARANRLAHRLRALGVGPEVQVGLYLDRSIDTVVAILAVLKAGGAYLPLDPVNPAERVAFILADAGARVVITGRALRDRLPAAMLPVVVLDDPGEDLGREPDTNPGAATAADSLAYVIYTSGSTGRPKGVQIQHDHVQRLFTATDPWFAFGPDDVWTLFHSYGFDFSVWEIWGALLYGGRLVVVRYLTSRSPDDFYELLSREGVTVLNQTPSAFRQLIAAEERLPAPLPLALRTVVFGGEALELESLRPWFDRHGDESPLLVNMYGITETTVHVTYRVVRRADLDARAGSVIGEPIPDLGLYLLDGNLEPVPAGARGEMFVGGAGVARGYLDRPELTAERFVPDPFSGIPGARMYRSGDLARVRGDADLEYLGRIDHQVKVRGHRIETGEIESVLTGCDGVREAAVLAVGGGEERRLVAYVAGGSVDVAAVRAHVKSRLPDYMMPAAFVVLDRLPLTPHGKLDRRALPEPGTEREQEAYAPPRTEAERILADVWREVLGVARVGIHDNFFALGGDSIRSIKVLAVARARGVDVSLQDIFQHQTIAAIGPSLAGTAAPEGPAAFALLTDAERAAVTAAFADAEDAYPLTRLQQGMLFQGAFDGTTAAYHNVSSFRLRIPFAADALTRTLERLAARHPALRTSLHPTGFGRPLQVVHQAIALPLEVHDGWSDGAFEAERRRRFDWTRVPLWRVVVHRRGPGELQLTLTEHHAIVDGWSVASLLSELMTEYLAAIGTLPPRDIEPPSSRFADYVARELAALEDPAARRFWDDAIAESVAPPLPPLAAAAAPRPPGAIVRERAIPADVVSGLEAIARDANVPFRTVLLAAHLRIVGLLTGVDDVVTGVVMNARPETADGERAIGLFLNTVPLRVGTAGATWRELVRRTFDAERAALPYRAFPMAEVQRIAGRPVFRTAFNYVHFHVYDALARVAGLEVLGQRGAAETELPLAASFSRDAATGEVRLSLECAEPAFDEDAVARVAAFYARALLTMAAAPDGRCDAFSAADVATLARWSVAPRQPGAALAPEQIAAHAAATPDDVAVQADGAALTYRELDMRAAHLAAALQRQGVGRGSIVALVSEATPDIVVAMLACWKAGAAFVPIDPSYPPERRASLLQDARPDVVLDGANLPAEAGSHSSGDLPAEAVRRWLPASAGSLDPDDLAYVIYTSGSTGTPKGVMATHRGLRNLLAGQIPRFGLSRSSRVLQFASLAFDAAISEIFTTLAAGGTLVLAPRAELRDPERVFQRLRDGAITTVTLPPALLALTAPDGSLPALQTVVSAGEACRDEIVRAWAPGRRLLNAYGPTETSVCATMTGPLAPDDGTPIGRPLENLETWVLDRWMNAVPARVTGELFVAGDSLARGYLGRPDLTAERFVPHPFSATAGARLYRTGDLARWRHDGQLEFLGRADAQVKIRGARVELGEVEAVLHAHEAVRQAAVVLHGSDGGLARLIAYVEHRGTPPATEDLRRWTAARLAEQAVPSTFVVMDALPLTASGKLDRRALPAPDESRPALEVPYAEPRTAVEGELAAIWAGVLRVDRVGVHDNFFRLGGDSILSLQVVSRARSRGLHLSPQQIFEHQTVADLAAVVRRVGASDTPAARPQGSVPLTPIQQWFVELEVPARHHWNQSLLLETPRDVDLAALQAALSAVVAHHDAFRLRLAGGDGSRGLEFSPAPAEVTLERIGTAALPDLQRSLDLDAGPLVRAGFAEPAPGQGRLLLVVHHLIVDGVSWRVLLDDLQFAYEQARAGRAIDLPPTTSSVQAWAQALEDAAASDMVAVHAPFWRAQVAVPAPSPAWAEGLDLTEQAAEILDTWLGRDATDELLHVVPPVYNTHTPEVLLAAIAHAVSPGRPLRLDMEAHGRDTALLERATGATLDLARTVGWFTSLFPAVVDVGGAGAPGAALKQVKEQLRAIPDGGLSYGLLRYLARDPLLAAAPPAAISFNYLGQLDGALSGRAGFRPAADPVGPMRDPAARRPHVLDIVASVEGGRLRLTWIHPRGDRARAEVERVAAATMQRLDELIRHCRQPEAGGYTPSDFPQMDFSPAELDALLDELEDRREPS